MICKDKVAIVTGAAGNGMGRSIALTLAREGAVVVVNYLTSAESAAAIISHIEARGGRAFAFQADIIQPDACRDLVQAAVETFGQVDICIIGPGGGWHPEPVGALNADGAWDDVRRELAPLYHLLPLVLPGMYARRWGRVIGLAQHPQKLSPAYAYNVGKATRMQSLLLAYEQAWQQGVTVNVVAPGPVAAIESLAKAIDLCDHGAAWQQRSNITPQDAAEGVAFLCSEAGRFVTGGVLPYLFHG